MASTQMELGLNLGLPQDAVDVNGRVWFRDLDGIRAVFVDQAPFYCYPLADPVQHRFCAIQLVEAGLVKVLEVCSAFGIHDRAFSRYRSSFRKHGFVGLVPGKGRPEIARKCFALRWYHPTLSAREKHLRHRRRAWHQSFHRSAHSPGRRRSTSFAFRSASAFAARRG